MVTNWQFSSDGEVQILGLQETEDLVSQGSISENVDTANLLKKGTGSCTKMIKNPKSSNEVYLF